MITILSASRRSSVNRSAFTLAEVMVSVLVMAIVFVGLYLGFTQGFGLIQVTRENLRANLKQGFAQLRFAFKLAHRPA